MTVRTSGRTDGRPSGARVAATSLVGVDGIKDEVVLPVTLTRHAQSVVGTFCMRAA